MISVEGITKYYGDKCALDNVSFKVDKGETVGLLGPNAAGKTTTMRILTGYFPPTSGTATVAGHILPDESLEVRKKIGYLPELVPLYTDMSVIDFLFFAGEAKRIPKCDLQKRVDSVIDDCNLNEYVYKPIKSLSKGYKQRVGLAQAIINSPEVLILDEPTVGMDPNQVMEIREIIKKLGEKSTIVLSSHILEEVAKTCGRVIIMNRGKILAIDTPENLSKQIETSDRIFFELLGDKEKAFNLIKSHKGINKCEYSKRDINEYGCFAIEVYAEKSIELRTSLLHELLDNEISVCQMALEKLTLEEIFTQVIAKGEKINKGKKCQEIQNKDTKETDEEADKESQKETEELDKKIEEKKNKVKKIKKAKKANKEEREKEGDK